MQQDTVRWRSPSNIALIKYWGKHGVQLPRNTSLSFTLSEAYTETSVRFVPRERVSDEIRLSFYFEGRENALFAKKIQVFLGSLIPYFPFLTQYYFEIHSKNSFPHSAGIASSASSMSALALCICQIEQRLTGDETLDEAFWQKASRIARLGSGSACRSVYARAAIWGKTPLLRASTDEWAIPMPERDLHPVFHDFQDTILIISADEKAVSSRAGHALMENHRFAEVRFQQAHDNLSALLPALRTGDLDAFMQITEDEALSLHALMMTSDPSFLLMRPGTLAAIEKIRDFRRMQSVPLCFTLDAGPNLHLLYPKQDAEAVLAFIKSELSKYCQEGRWIRDEVGEGATPY